MEEGGRGRPGGPRRLCLGSPASRRPRGSGAGPPPMCAAYAAAAGEPFHPRGPARALLPRRGGGCPWLLRGPFLPVDAPGVMLASAASRVRGAQADH